MDAGNEPALFGLSLDANTKPEFADAARWARFIAIVGMVFMVLAVVGVAAFVYFLHAAESSFSEAGGGNRSFFSTFSIGIAVFYLLLLLIWFFPLWYLFQFSKRMRTALQGDDQQALFAAARNLKMCFRYIGILTIVILCIYGLGMLFGVLGLAFMGS
jgi:hypothetical protein